MCYSETKYLAGICLQHFIQNKSLDVNKCSDMYNKYYKHER